MNRGNKTGNYVIWGMALLAVPLCLFTVAEPGMHHRISPVMRFLNQTIAVTAYSMFALTFILSARIKWMEYYFGGPDKMYQAHHKMAAAAFILMALHPFLLALRWVPDHPGRFFLAVFPIHQRFEVNLGSYALWGVILLMLFTLVVKLPYRIWKISHKFMGLFFILALVHTFHLTVTFSENPLLSVYLGIISCLGLAAFTYQTVLFKVFNNGVLYKVDVIEKFNERIMNITLSPYGKKQHFRPGQFCFFSFNYDGISRESHPFTLFDGEKGDGIQIMVKTLGDYTRQLYNTIKPGAEVRLTGPYGCFNLTTTGKKQIWIAGGVGIAPFISWVRSLKRHPLPGFNAELYYCVSHRNDAVFLNELKAFEQSFPGFSTKLVCTQERDRLSAGEILNIAGKEIFLCGPRCLCKSLVGELRDMGVPSPVIHYENFDF